MYHERAHFSANEIVCNRILLARFVNKNMEVNRIQIGVVYTFNVNVGLRKKQHFLFVCLIYVVTGR